MKNKNQSDETESKPTTPKPAEPSSTNKLVSFIALSVFAVASLFSSNLGVVSSAYAAVDSVTTNTATGVTSANATLNGTLGFDPATQSSFWVSTSPFSTAVPVLPPGVYSTADLGPFASSSAYSASLTSVLGLPSVTASTTYYFAAWANVNGTWTPGAVMNFTTLPSSDATLSNLTISSGTLSPAFTSGVTSYTDSVLNTVTSVTVTPTTNEANATITVNGNVVLSGVASSPITLNVGANTVLTVATAQNGVATSTYTIVVTRDTGTTSGTVGGSVTGGLDPNGMLHVTSISTIKSTATADGTFANGWKYVFHITAPTNETKLSMKFSDWATLVSSSTIAVANNMRISSAQADNAGATILLTAADPTYSGILNMTGDIDAGTIGRQVDVTVEVAVPVSSVNGSYTTNYGIKTIQ